MAYAVLSFTSTVTAGQRLKDMAKVITGAATSVTNLEFATQASSEIVSAEPAGWTLADTGSALEESGTATKVEYRFSAPCVNSGKTKYAAIATYSSYINTVISGGSTLTNARTASTATSGYLYLFSGSGVSGNAIQNPVGIPLTILDNAGGTGSAWQSAITISGSQQYIVSVTARKIIIVGISAPSSTANAMQAMLEFPETSSTTLYNNVPNAGFYFYSATAATAPSGAWSGTSISVGSLIQRTVSLPNWYRYSDNTRTPRVGDDATTFMFCPTAPVAGIDPNTSLTQNPLIPLIDFRQAFGEGTHDYSSLTDLYFTRLVNHLDTITVGGDTYVALTVSDRSLCVKKA